MTTRFEIIAYPHGKRRVVGVCYATTTMEIIRHAAIQAVTRGEYVDVECDGDRIAIVGAEGQIG